MGTEWVKAAKIVTCYFLFYLFVYLFLGNMFISAYHANRMHIFKHNNMENEYHIRVYKCMKKNIYEDSSRKYSHYQQLKKRSGKE